MRKYACYVKRRKKKKLKVAFLHLLFIPKEIKSPENLKISFRTRLDFRKM